MASHYYIKYRGKNPKGKHTYEVLVKEEVTERGQTYKQPVHPLNDNIPPELLIELYNGTLTI